MTTNPTRGNSAHIYYVQETTPGTTPTNPAYVKFSDYVQDVSISVDPKNEFWYDIGSFDAQTATQGLPHYSLKVEYILHVNRGTQLTDAIARLSDGTLQSASIEVQVGTALGGGAGAGYFTFKGCKASDVSVKAAEGKPTMVTITYEALAMTPSSSLPNIGTGTRESAALGSVSTYAAGSITRGGAVVAYSTRGATFDVKQNLTVVGTDGQATPKTIFEGKREAKGSIDMTVDDGGVALMNAVTAGTDAEIDYNLGAPASGATVVKFLNARWDKLDIPVKAGEAFIKQNVPWTNRANDTGVSGITLATA